MGNRRKKIGTLLVEAGHISTFQLDHALHCKLPNEKIGEYLIKEGYITEMQLIEQLEHQLGIPHIQLNQLEIEPSVIQLIPSELAKRTLILPFKIEGNKLFLVMVDPMNFFAIEEARMCTGYQIEVGITTKDELMLAIMKYYDLQESVEAVMEDYEVIDVIESDYFKDENSAVVRLVNNIIIKAVAQNASDIHFDPQETELIVRYRVDGLLVTERSLPKTMQSVVIARIKIMGNLNITEYRVPQDGRIKANYNAKSIDIRLSTLPTVYGEKVVMRILDLNSATNDLTKLGFREKICSYLNK